MWNSSTLSNEKMDERAGQQATAKKKAGEELAKSTNLIKRLPGMLAEQQEEERAKLKKKIPTTPGGWVSAQDWINTLGRLDPALSDSQPTK